MGSRPNFTKSFVDRFGPTDLLGEGGMGWVFRGRLGESGQAVAVKVLKESTAEDLARFRREAQLLVGLRHPGIVEVLEHGVDGGHPYLVMELIQGTELGRAFREVPRDAARARDVLAAVADALAHLHRRGIVHRDVKPENILIGPAGEVRLVDFGLARSTQAGQTVTKTGIIMGTPAYMAPEQVEGGVLGPAVDQYALGVVAFELFAGRLPFEGEDALSQATARLTLTPPPLRSLAPHLPVSLEALVSRMLQRRPADRYEDMDAVGQALRGGSRSTHKTVKIHRPASLDASRTSRTLGLSRRRPGMLSGLAAVMVVGFVAAVAYWKSGSGLPDPVLSSSAVAGRASPSTPPPAVYIPLDERGLTLCRQINELMIQYRSKRDRKSEDVDFDRVARDRNLPVIAPLLKAGLDRAEELQKVAADQKLRGPDWLVIASALEDVLANTAQATGFNVEHFPDLVKSLSDRALGVLQRRPLYSDFHHDKVLVPLVRISHDLARGPSRGGCDKDQAALRTLMLYKLLRNTHRQGWRNPTELDQWLRILVRSVDWADSALSTIPDRLLESDHAGLKTSIAGRRELVALLQEILPTTPVWLQRNSALRARLLACFGPLLTSFEPALGLPEVELRQTAEVLDQLLAQCVPEDLDLLWGLARPTLAWTFYELAAPECARLGFKLEFARKFPIPSTNFRKKPTGGFRSANKDSDR